MFVSHLLLDNRYYPV